jgi:hypothetical protein
MAAVVAPSECMSLAPLGFRIHRWLSWLVGWQVVPSVLALRRRVRRAVARSG